MPLSFFCPSILHISLSSPLSLSLPPLPPISPYLPCPPLPPTPYSLSLSLLSTPTPSFSLSLSLSLCPPYTSLSLLPTSLLLSSTPLSLSSPFPLPSSFPLSLSPPASSSLVPVSIPDPRLNLAMCLWKKRKSARPPHHQWRHFLSFRPSEPSLWVNSNANGTGTAAAGMAAASTSSASLSFDHHPSSEYSRGSSSPSANSAASSHIKDIISEGPSLFSFAQISQATDGFKPSNALAPSVWKGVLRSRGPVVIARKKPAAPDILAEVLEEKLRAASSLNHFNVAKLYGLCRRRGRGDLYLVYELVEGGGSLRDCLRSKVNPGYSTLGSWRTRVQIALDVAKGLEYLHHHAAADRPFIHKHIQGDNILVTKDLRAKIAYFGLAELTGELAEDLRQMEEAALSADEEPESPDIDSPRDGHKKKRSRKVQITASQGYAPPEYLLGGVLTAKYDVYSFGVVLLELLSGKEAFSLRRDALSRKAPRTTTLAEEIHGLLDKPRGGEDNDDGKSKLRLWMDSTLNDSFPMEDVLSVASIARSCVDYSPKNRPDMGYIARKLSRILSAAHKWEEARNTLSTTIVPR